MPPTAITLPFENWDEKKLQEIMKAFQSNFLSRNRKYLDGDHWQDGTAWIGPKPKGQTADEFQQTMKIIKDGFVSRNVIAEVVERHVTGVVGREPRWGFTVRRSVEEGEEITDQERNTILELESAMTEWWDKRGVHGMLHDRAAMLLWARRAPFRLYVPGGRLRDGEQSGVGSAEATDLRDALMSYIFLDEPSPEQCGIYVDPDTQWPAGIFRRELTDEEGNPSGKFQWEVVWQSEKDETLTRIMIVEGESKRVMDLPFNGIQTIHQESRRLLITDQVVQNQNALNLALSTLPRNVVSGGWLERVILNAQMPGKWEKNDEGELTKFIPEPYQTGAGTTNFLQGYQVEDEEGNVKVTTPNVKWRDPVPVKGSIEAEQAHYAAILDEADQAHVLTNSDAAPSGRSREQARADYEGSLDLSAAPLARAGRWILDSALGIAEGLINSPGKYTKDYRAYFEPIIDTGPTSADERGRNTDDYKAGTLSRETAMSRNGVDDTEAEIKLINSQPGSNLDLLARQAEVMVSLTTAGMTLEAAGRLAELDEEQIKIIQTSVTDFTGQTEQ